MMEPHRCVQSLYCLSCNTAACIACSGPHQGHKVVDDATRRSQVEARLLQLIGDISTNVVPKMFDIIAECKRKQSHAEQRLGSFSEAYSDYKVLLEPGKNRYMNNACVELVEKQLQIVLRE